VKPEEVEALAPLAPLLATVWAWRQFKRSHNLADAKICCCARTRKLFDSLDELEKEILSDKGPLA
jgi:hypothetical protein